MYTCHVFKFTFLPVEADFLHIDLILYENLKGNFFLEMFSIVYILIDFVNTCLHLFGSKNPDLVFVRFSVNVACMHYY